jgi:hypothetical protein
MNLAKIASRRQRIIQYLLFLGTTIAVVVGLAQTQGRSPDRILVDGQIEPDRIPDWIVWNEIFRMAVRLDEVSPTHGQELWMKKLHLPEEVMQEIISQGYEYMEMSSAIDNEAREHVSNSKSANSDLKDHPDKKVALQSRLIKSQLNLESQTLEMRDKLRARIGDDAFLRIESFAHLQIVPRVKIGG